MASSDDTVTSKTPENSSTNTQSNLTSIDDSQIENSRRDAVILIKPQSDSINELLNDPIEIVSAIEGSKFQNQL